MFAAISGLSSHQSKMDVISNNIANVNTWGYKSRTANFQDAMYQNVVQSTNGDTQEGGLGGVNSSQLGYGVNVGSISTNFGSGSRSFTGYGLNCMIDGTGFFIVGAMSANPIGSDELAESQLKLSRVGLFTVDGNGYFLDDTGNYVYGFAPTTATDPETTYKTNELVPIQIPINPDADGDGIDDSTVDTNGDGVVDENDASTTRYEVQTVRIANDGTVVGITTDAKEIMIGKIAIASVENPNGLVQKSGYLYEIGDNAGQVNAIETVGSTTGNILSGYLEMSNVDLATEIANMITTQRGYQANSKIITVTDEMLEQLVNMKR